MTQAERIYKLEATVRQLVEFLQKEHAAFPCARCGKLVKRREQTPVGAGEQDARGNYKGQPAGCVECAHRWRRGEFDTKEKTRP